jgi:hypothetical protein
MAEIAEGVLTQDIAYTVYVVSTGWEDRLEELAALLGARFRMSTAAAMNALQSGEVVVTEADGLHAASNVIEDLARMSIVAAVRPVSAPARAPERTMHVGWAHAPGRSPGQVEGRTMVGGPSQVVDQTDLPEPAVRPSGAALPPILAPDAAVPSPWAAALASPADSPTGGVRSSAARERAALLRGERAPALTPATPVMPPEQAQGSPALTRIPSVSDDAGLTIIMADESAKAVALLQNHAPASATNPVVAQSPRAWGAVLGKAVEAEAASVVLPVSSPSAVAPSSPDVPDSANPLTALAAAEETPNTPARGGRAAFVRLRSPGETRLSPASPSSANAHSTPGKPLHAALFSVLAPGAGQAYNNEQGRAVTFALAGVLIVPWAFSVRDAWQDASSGLNRQRTGAPNVRAAVSVALTFWLLVGLFATLIWSIDRATTNPTPAAQVAAAPVPFPEPAAVPVIEEPVATQDAEEASADPTLARAELRDRVAGLVARAQLACNNAEYVDCRQLAEQALALDETDPGAHRIHVVAIDGISGFQDRLDAAASNGSATGPAPGPRQAVHPGVVVPDQPNFVPPSPTAPTPPVTP